MYQEFFGLHRRPFAATPDPGCWHHEPPFQPALDELVVCCQQGQGIGIVIGPAGAGKTLLCERIVRELHDEFATVFLRHATFATRRALLQSILCERGRPFDKLTDQELRLGVSAMLNELHQHRRALVLIVDEAHHLSEAVLDELRILADQSRDGRPLVRLILSGQLSLEDKLASPGAEALNQRIRAHVILPALTRRESADYVDYRITWAGGRTEELFDAEALDEVCRAAAGSPRCLNQLCDHALLLAYVKEEAPVTAQTVLEALDDLRRLPLHWNTSTAERLKEPPPAVEIDCRADARELIDNVADTVTASTAWDVPLIADASSSPLPQGIELPRQGSPADLPDLPLPASRQTPQVFAAAAPLAWSSHEAPRSERDETDEACEEPVIDRYTALDAGLGLPAALAFRAPETPTRSPADVLSDWWRDGGEAQLLNDRLAAVQHVLDAVAAVDDEPLPGLSIPAVGCPAGADDAEDRLASTVLELATEAHESAQPQPAALAQPAAVGGATSKTAVFEIGADLSTVESLRSPSAPVRSCRNLFTLLRRKQQGRA